MEIKYCIECGKEAPVTETQGGYVHIFTVHTSWFDIGYIDYDVIVCNGPFANSEPPIIPDNLQLTEPSPTELTISNAYALELQADFQ